MTSHRRRRFIRAAATAAALSTLLAVPATHDAAAPFRALFISQLSAQQGLPPRVTIRLAAEDQTQRLELADGSRLIGRVVGDGDPVEFELASGSVLLVARETIRGLTTVEGRVENGTFWRDDPSHNRLFFGPTGRTVGKGHGYVAVFEAIFPSISYGFHDRITLGGGTLLIGDFEGSHPVWFVPKFNLFQTDKGAMSVGALLLNAGNDWARIVYGVGTVGSKERSVTAGVGFGSAGDNGGLDVTVGQLGALVRVHENLALMTENYLRSHESEEVAILGGGVRFIGDRLTADLGVAIPVEDPILLPLVNFVWNW